MTPSEFKARFLASLPSIPDNIDLSLDEFVLFPLERVQALRIADADKRILVESGLPADASPFLSFGLSDDRMLLPIDGFPESFAIGHNGCGDHICIDQSAAGEIVYYNHDNNMRRVLMNSSLGQFAESLCLFAEFMKTKDQDSFTRQLQTLDGIALAAGAFWPDEVRSELES
jgi:hypothetical protein